MSMIDIRQAKNPPLMFSTMMALDWQLGGLKSSGCAAIWIVRKIPIPSSSSYVVCLSIRMVTALTFEVGPSALSSPFYLLSSGSPLSSSLLISSPFS